jgi:thiol-disulfide isomerase/thioredoxin
MARRFLTPPSRTRNLGPQLAVLACSLAFIATGCRGAAPTEAEIEEESGEPVTVRLLQEPADVPAFTVTDLDGKSITSAELRGKVVLVNFWATWCGPCRAEIPDLVTLQDKYRDSLVVLGISEDEGGVDLVRRFADQYKINYTIAMTTPEIRAAFPEIMALPTTFVLDRDGKMVQKNVGMLNARETEAGTRLLAGLKTNAEVVRWDGKEKVLGLENAAQMKSVPGVDLSGLSPAERTTALLALNAEECNCGCHLTVARCRVDDPTCAVSLPQAKAIVEKIAAKK